LTEEHIRKVGLSRDQPKIPHYSTVIDLLKGDMRKWDISIIFSFTINVITSKLTKTSHYNKKQQKIYDTIKYLKEVEGLGYRRISHRLKELGIKSSRSNKELKFNYVYGIWKKKKGKIREDRINREFKDTISDMDFHLVGK